MAILGVSATPPAYGATRSVVWLDGHAYKMRRPTTIRALLGRAHMIPRDGALLAASSGKVVDPHDDPALLYVDGKPAKLGTRVRPGDHVGVLEGRNRIESVFVRPDVVPPAHPLPDLEGDLWAPGANGLTFDAVGVRSGEVHPQLVVHAPVDATRVPGRVIALSFDDGPDPRYTPRILDILEHSGVHATFCVVGYEARARPDLLQREHNDGDMVCDHTEHHAHLDQLAAPDIDNEISSPATFMQQTIGVAPTFVRLPYEGVNPTVIDVIHRRGRRILAWNIDPADYNRPPASVIASRVLSAARPGAIVLMHDGGGDRSNTVAALPTIISGLQARGFSIVLPKG